MTTLDKIIYFQALWSEALWSEALWSEARSPIYSKLLDFCCCTENRKKEKKPLTLLQEKEEEAEFKFDDFDPDSCLLCLTSVDELDIINYMLTCKKCKYVVCFDCIQHWFTTKPTCPGCRGYNTYGM